MPSLCPRVGPECSQISAGWTAVDMAVIAKVGFGQVVVPKQGSLPSV